MFKFEKVSRYAHEDIAPPVRKTENSACYDMVAAEDVIIQPYQPSMNALGEVIYLPTVTDDDKLNLDLAFQGKANKWFDPQVEKELAKKELNKFGYDLHS